MIKFYLSFIAVLVTLFSFAQISVTIAPSKDITIFSQPSSNSDALGGFVYAGVTNNNSIRRALVRFDISSIPVGSLITSATITLKMVKTVGGNIAVNLHRLNADWGEGTSNGGSGVDGGGSGAAATANDATWINRFHPSTAWATAGGSFSATISATTSVSGVGTYTWSGAQLINDLQTWLSNSTTNFGWLIKTTEVGSRNVKKFSSRNNAAISERPSLSITYTAPTPVTLAYLKATEVKEGVLINWQTQTELNNAFFSIEHSSNGTNFSALGRVNGAGTSSTIKNYNFIHQGVPQGKHYYRLAQADINGQVNYSAIVTVSLKNKHKEIKISPNPVSDILTLKGIRIDKEISYSIVNASGAVVSSGRLMSSQVPINNLPPGYYTISLFDGGDGYFGRFLKK